MTNTNISSLAFGVKLKGKQKRGICFVEAYVDNSCKNLVFNWVLKFFLANCQCCIHGWCLELPLLSHLLEMKILYTNLTSNITAWQRAEMVWYCQYCIAFELVWIVTWFMIGICLLCNVCEDKREYLTSNELVKKQRWENVSLCWSRDWLQRSKMSLCLWVHMG